MRVAAIYDIHGNLPALEAVLKEIQKAGVDLVVVGGDVVPGPMPRAVIEALLHLNLSVRFIQGNGERDVLTLVEGNPLDRVPEAFHAVMRWVANELEEEHIGLMAAWPLTWQVDIPGLGSVLFCHATPRSDNEIFTRLTPEDRLRPVFEGTNASVVVCGHTHMPFDRMIGKVRVLNAGSVGMPFGEPGAYWALLGPGIALRRTAYDLSAAEARIRATAYPNVSGFRVLNPPSEAQMLEIFETASPHTG